MHARLRTIVWLLILCLALPGLVEAARKGGRLIGKVVDPDGEPVEGVTVVATCAEVSRYEESDVTDEKGIFKIEFPYLDVVYTLRFAKDGYHPLESQQDWNLEGTARDEFVMYPGQETVGAVSLASTSNRAIHAFNQGVEAYNADDFATAEVRFEEALEHDPEMHQAWSALGRVFLKRGQYQQAVQATERAVELGATDEEVWRTRWEAYRNLGDEEKAAEAMDDLEAAGLRAQQAVKLHNEAVALSRAGDHEAALAKFQEALQMDPNLETALLGVATTGLDLGRYAEAAEAARRILRADPGNEQALRIRYNAALGLEDREMIVDALVGLAQVDPSIALQGLNQLAQAAYEADDAVRAEDLFTKVLAIDPDHAQSHYLIGLLFLRKGANQEAIHHLERFVELAPDDPEAPTAQDILAYLKQS